MNTRRRSLIGALGAVSAVGGTAALTGTSRTLWAAPNAAQSATALAELETASGGRLGVHAVDTGTGRRVGHRDDSRFGMCSTFKLLLAAAILREADAGRISLEQLVRIGKADMVPHAPVTQAFLGKGGMRVRELAEAAQTTSDNVATNLLLKLLGGPAGFTALLRAMGDATTRLDRIETAMNFVPAGEIRDTTTPRAMADSVARVMTGDVLKPASRELLTGWTIATQTGLKRIRAGLPAGWRAGDKTGTASAKTMPNKHNDVAIFWPPGRAPIIVAAYFEAAGHFEPMRAADDAVLARAGRLVADWAMRG